MDMITVALAKRAEKKAAASEAQCEQAQDACEEAASKCAGYVGNTKISVSVDESDGHVIFAYSDK